MKMSEVSVEDITQGLGDTAFGLVVDGGIIRDRKQLEEIVRRYKCHDDLVEALEGAITELKGGYSDCPASWEEALKKAKL